LDAGINSCENYFYVMKKNPDPVLETVKNPILPDPVIPPENSEFKEPVTDESVINIPVPGPPGIAGYDTIIIPEPPFLPPAPPPRLPPPPPPVFVTPAVPFGVVTSPPDPPPPIPPDPP
jgi:hypothetical protein